MLSPGTGIGTLTVNSDVPLQAGCANLMEVSQAAQVSDQLVVAGTLNCGGTLVVTNLSGAFVGGETSRLSRREPSPARLAPSSCRSWTAVWPGTPIT